MLPVAHLKLIDVGSGSGAIALARASELPRGEIDACDISDDALEMARVNAARLGLEQRVSYRKSDLLAAYAGEQFDLVVSNPPYVGESEVDKVQRQVREFEPKIAVFSGDEGMDIYSRLLPQANEALNPGGRLVVEIGFSTEQSVRELLEGWADIQATPALHTIPPLIAPKRPLS